MIAVLALAMLTPVTSWAGLSQIYVALGDSNTFGNDESVPSSTMPNYGDQGFVRPFADFLGSLNGGVRPQVVNLAISGELSSSFLLRCRPIRLAEPRVVLEPQLSERHDLAEQPDALRARRRPRRGQHGLGDPQLRGQRSHHLVASTAWQTASPSEQQALFTQLLNQICPQL